MVRSEVRRLPVVVVLAAGLLGAAPQAEAAKPRPSLRAFDSCAGLVSYARRNAVRTDGGTGVPSRLPVLAPAPLVRPVSIPTAGADASAGAIPPASAPAPAAATSGKAEAGTDFSQTNAQEAGVDEPDLIKTDGRRIVALAQGQLLVIDVTGPAPVLRGRLALPGSGQQLLVRGDTVLVMATSYGGAQVTAQARQSTEPAPAVAPVPPRTSIARPSVRPTTTITEVDVADAAAPAIRRTLTVDGSLVDARQTEGTARVVITTPPRPVAEPAEASLRTWVPRTTTRSRVSGRTFQRGVVPCDDVRRPAAFSGLDLLSVLTIDLDRGLYSVDRDAILAGAQTVYASTDSLYVASRTYSPAVEAGTSVPAGTRTQIHRYDARGSEDTVYRSSGEVPGFVLNQYAMSEHEGALRVATTSEPQWFPDGTQPVPGQSRVTVLRQDGPALKQIGQVGGLGENERIYAVRFLGDRGYVVTFRQADPLYTLDLSDPTAPKVRGELKILGYSAYLHPVGEGRLLGVGQDATEAGRTTGAQVSLFDVSDAAAPTRIAAAPLGDGTSTDAEFDPHAFLFWGPTRLTVLPLQRYPRSSGDPGFAGAVGLRVGTDTLSEVGRISHPQADPTLGAPPIGRSLVIGTRLYSLSAEGLLASNLADLVPLGYTPFSA